MFNIHCACCSERRFIAVWLHSCTATHVACLKHLYQVGLRAVGTPWDRPALTLAVGGRGAISERWVVAAHLPESSWLTSRPAAVQSTRRQGAACGHTARLRACLKKRDKFRVLISFYYCSYWLLKLSCHSMAAVLTPVQTVVTRWQQSLHQYRQNK
jgi:hypothetical protein